MVSFDFEKDCWDKGLDIVAGADEVGRGCFAGPVVAACVVFSRVDCLNASSRSVGGRYEVKFPGSSFIYIDDSKKLTHVQRVKASLWIEKHARAWGVGQASVSEINRLGLGKSTNRAFRRAVASLVNKLQHGSRVDRLLVDAFYVPFLKGLPISNQEAIKGGDGKSFSIAAASIVAKVYRDKLMFRLGSLDKYIDYKWKKNKGYGTREHIYAISKYGITKYHRRSFVSKCLTKQDLSSYG